MTYKVINGKSGNDCLFGTDDDDVIDGGAGADIL
jgi:Ca2+-binding RTX toxin-like protein